MVSASKTIFFLLKVYFESLIITTGAICLQLKQPWLLILLTVKHPEWDCITHTILTNTILYILWVQRSRAHMILLCQYPKVSAATEINICKGNKIMLSIPAQKMVLNISTTLTTTSLSQPPAPTTPWLLVPFLSNSHLSWVTRSQASMQKVSQMGTYKDVATCIIPMLMLIKSPCCKVSRWFVNTTKLSTAWQHVPVPDQRQPRVSCSWYECAESQVDPLCPEFQCPLRDQNDLRRKMQYLNFQQRVNLGHRTGNDSPATATILKLLTWNYHTRQWQQQDGHFPGKPGLACFPRFPSSLFQKRTFGINGTAWMPLMAI